MGTSKTTKSWAVEIKSYEDVPRIFKEYFSAFSGKESVFPYTVFTPPYKWHINKIIGKMLYFLDDRVVFLEKVKTEITVTEYYFKDINYLTAGRDLLYSWLVVEGISGGKLTTSTIEYDAVVHYLFEPIIEKIRESANSYGESDLKSERSKFDYLCNSHFKFMNYGKGSIRQGEKVVDMLIQGCIRVISFDLYIKKFYRILSNAHMNILTDKELILIKESNHKGANYGHTWTYIPVHKIEGIQISPNEKDSTFMLTLNLKNQGKVYSIFEASNKAALDTLLGNLGKVG